MADRRRAAIFDLDRTLLRGGSGPVISKALQEVGLLPERRIPGEGLLFRAFELFGESRLAMIGTRNAARFTAGWSRSTAQKAGQLAADVLVPMVQPFARPLIAEHHAAGRVVALATTTPLDVVRPFAEALGIEEVVATQHGERDDGSYDGSIAGEFVWGPGKLRAVATQMNSVPNAVTPRGVEHPGCRWRSCRRRRSAERSDAERR